MTIERAYKPQSKAQLLDLLNENRADAKIIAGGTDIIISMRNKRIAPKALIDVSHLEEIKQIKEEDDKILIGAAVTFTQLVESELFLGNLFGLHKSARMVGSPQIRNKGTIGGNIANGSAAADIAPPLLALDAKLLIESKDGSREISLEDYYQSKEKLEDNELLSTISFKKPKDSQVLSFSKLGLRKALAISRLTLASLVDFADDGRIKDINLASGALGRYPMRESLTEEFLKNKKIDGQLIEDTIVELQKDLDVRLEGRSTLPYKREAAESILREALEEAEDFFKRAVKK